MSCSPICRKTFVQQVTANAPVFRYWTLDETGTNSRIDSVNGDSLVAFINRVSFDEQPGLFGNALHLDTLSPTDTHGGCGIMSSLTTWINTSYPLVDTPDNGFSVAGWFKTITPRTPYSFLVLDIITDTDDLFSVQLSVGSSSSFFYIDANSDYDSIPTVLPSGAWTFFHIFFDKSLGKAGFSINNGAESTHGSGLVCGTGTRYGLTMVSSGTFPLTEILWDEIIAVFNGKLTSAQVAYLYNGGAGRTWPISLP